MIDFFNRLFGKQSSGATAKERLRLVLMSDHLSLAPEMIESMKRDLVDVISRYVEVDRSKIDVHFENQDNALAMLANIPITGVARNTPPDPPAPPSNGSTDTNERAEATTSLARHGEPVEPQPSNGEARAPRRKKRKKQGGPGHHSGAPAPAT
jgi:cell division topological specificity factor